ncbi:MAG: hydroxyethylthiazole kinase [Lachnospiraceae bacterium]|nr:hydroxyethylthiazole kinase [Lachnospiraceae bacterium]
MKQEQMKAEYIWDMIQRIRANRPIIHCITNAVTVNDCANVLLAVGASPTMAHHPLEVAEIVEGADALVCNFGAIEDYEAMLTAGQKAAELGKPVVVDPVGVSGSGYRREKCLDFIKNIHPSCIRGNYSEIRALLGNCSTVTGVDAAASDTDKDPEKQRGLLQEMGEFSQKYRVILAASGEMDLLTDGTTEIRIGNGHPDMTRITGTGCMSSVMFGAFLSQKNEVRTAAAACAWMGIAGELAAERTQARHGGTMTFHDCFLDEMSLMKREDIERRKQVSIICSP